MKPEVAAATGPHLMSWIEAAVAGGFTLLFFLFAFFAFKPEHVEHHPNRVYLGAALHGFIVGALVAFVVLPLRFALFVPDMSLVPDAPPPPPKGLASLSILPALLLLLVIRRGVLARMPLIGPFIRAYRRAALKHQIDSARKTLLRLEALDARAATKDV